MKSIVYPLFASLLLLLRRVATAAFLARGPNAARAIRSMNYNRGVPNSYLDSLDSPSSSSSSSSSSSFPYEPSYSSSAAVPATAAPVATSYAAGANGRSFSSISSSTSGSTRIVLDPSETAIVLIEYQNEFTAEGGKLHSAVKAVMEATNMLYKSKQLTDQARACGCTVVHIPIAFEPGHYEISSQAYGILSNIKENECFTMGTWGAQISDAMKPLAPTDLIAKGKSGLCAFETTNLDFLLRQQGIKTILLAGFLTNCCVESTMRTAYEKGYTVYTVRDCCAATSQTAHDAAFDYNFEMFSIPTTFEEMWTALIAAGQQKVQQQQQLSQVVAAATSEVPV